MRQPFEEFTSYQSHSVRAEPKFRYTGVLKAADNFTDRCECFLSEIDISDERS